MFIIEPRSIKQFSFILYVGSLLIKIMIISYDPSSFFKFELDDCCILYLDEHFPKVTKKALKEMEALSAECEVLKRIYELANDANSNAQDASDFIKDRVRNADAQLVRKN